MSFPKPIESYLDFRDFSFDQFFDNFRREEISIGYQ